MSAAGQDTPADRQYAYDIVRVHEEDSAPTMFARAAVTGRLVQQKGLMAAHLIPEIERCARRSRDLDPKFRGGAATRLLGTLYVMAPVGLVQHGDSEEGVLLLEGLVQTHPTVPENHLRLAEAYIALGDPAPAAAGRSAKSLWRVRRRLPMRCESQAGLPMRASNLKRASAYTSRFRDHCHSA